MANFILIFLSLLMGILLKRTGKLPPNAHQAFNAFVIFISLPATVLIQIPKLLRTTELTSEMLVPVSMAWITFLISFLCFISLGKKIGFKRSEIGALILMAGLGNTSFVGFPLLEAIIGPEAIPTAVIVDQLGSFLVLSTIGLVFCSAYSPNPNRPISFREITKNIFSFPPFLSLIVAGLWYLSGTSENKNLVQTLERLAGTLVPLALVAVGLQLKVTVQVLRKNAKALFFGLGFKLFLLPALFSLLYVGIGHSHGQLTRITLLESAMAPMITAGVVAEDFGFDAEIVRLLIGVGIPFSLITVCLWNQVLLKFL
jgi:predicted permease